MPLLPCSSYAAPIWLPGGHAQTIFPSLLRSLPELSFNRAFIPTPDGDRIALDMLPAGEKQGKSVVILSHGLEGSSKRKYMRGMCRIFAAQGWDCAARNFHGCGGEPNLTPGLYHSGQTEDLHTTVLYCLELGYERIALVGFSMGGNQVLKYLGEEPDRVPGRVAAAAVFSVTCHLPGAARVLDQPGNAVYMRYFLRTLRKKVRQKHALYPELYPLDGLEAIRTFAEFDGRYTAPIHGFASARDYWEKAASLPHLPRIAVPALLVNARNDPFLSKDCYPVHTARQSRFLFLEMPDNGGHVGFTSRLGETVYWSETRAVEFFRQYLP
jgi:predicted alpha/beta-fold hydrolase